MPEKVSPETKDPWGSQNPKGLVPPEALLELIRTRRSIRRYQDRPVPDEMIEQLLEAARWAPSSTNSQPWEFIVVRDPELRRLIGEHSVYFFVRQQHVGQAPVVIVLCSRLVRTPFYREDVALASANIMLQAHALGLGTCWIGAIDKKAIARLVNLPAGHQVLGLLTVGFPAEDPPPPRRKPLDSLVHYDVYGNRKPGAPVKPGPFSSGILSIVLRKLRLPLLPWF